MLVKLILKFHFYVKKTGLLWKKLTFTKSGNALKSFHKPGRKFQSLTPEFFLAHYNQKTYVHAYKNFEFYFLIYFTNVLKCIQRFKLFQTKATSSQFLSAVCSFFDKQTLHDLNIMKLVAYEK